MDFFLKNRHGAFPVEVTIDEDNHRYTIRNVDTTGEFFNSPAELAVWVANNLMKEDFENPDEFDRLLTHMSQFSNSAL